MEHSRTSLNKKIYVLIFSFSLLASSGLDGDLHFWSILDAKYINTFEGNNLKNTFTPFTVHI